MKKLHIEQSHKGREEAESGGDKEDNENSEEWEDDEVKEALDPYQGGIGLILALAEQGVFLKKNAINVALMANIGRELPYQGNPTGEVQGTDTFLDDLKFYNLAKGMATGDPPLFLVQSPGTVEVCDRLVNIFSSVILLQPL